MPRDPAFLFYDADAARDVSHMNRLERGCYFDLIQAQNKFGRLPLPQITRILGKDFDTCWPALDAILSKEILPGAPDGIYHIQWLEEAIEKRKNFSKSRSANRNSKPGKVVSEAVTSVSDNYSNDDQPLLHQMADKWKGYLPGYPVSKQDDYPALLDFVRFICEVNKIELELTSPQSKEKIMIIWDKMCLVISDHLSWKKKSLQALAKFNKQEIYTQSTEADEEKKMVL